MTTPVRIQQSIRQLETKGLTHTQIARELGVSRTTVVKYATRDYSPVPPTGGTASRSLVAGEYARKADEWLEADRRMPRKQRHTARRVHERLVEECGFEGSYSSVQRWVKRWRQRHRGEAEGFSELEWAPGSAQVDFGQALAVVAGVERTVHFLVVSFPYSNMRYVAALPGETAECVCHGLNKVLSHAGMVPRVLVFDNATGVGHRRADGTVTQTRLFSLFCAHYGFETRFCNPYSGHEKGSTENAVGFLRRNLMVPTPSAEGWDRLTDAWLERCDEIARGVHYREDVPIRDLFETDLDHMLPLPPSMFDACDWRGVKADRTGTVTIDSNRYLAGPKWRSMRLMAGVRALRVELRSMDGDPIVTLERRWGRSPTPRWTRCRCSPSSRASRVRGARVPYAPISRRRRACCSTGWSRANVACWSTASAARPWRVASVRPPWPSSRSSPRAEGPTGPRSTRRPGGSRRATVPNRGPGSTRTAGS